MAQKKTTSVTKTRTNSQPTKGSYTCCTCGKTYSAQHNNFPSVQSITWSGNDYYLPMCKYCVDDLYNHYLELYDDDINKAIRRICTMFDMYYRDDIVEASGNIARNRSRISSYISRLNMTQYSRKTYDTTVKEEFTGVLTPEEYEEDKENGTAQVSRAAVERWGVGMFNYNEYTTLEEHYKMLKRNNPNIDNNQEIFVKDLCIIHMMKMQAAKDKDSDAYNKASDQYSKIFAKAGLKTVEEKDSSNNDTFGVTLATISQHTPEEFYKDKKLYADYDELGEYYDRHIRRPMQNLMMGTNIRDTEFYVPEEVDGEIDV